MLFNSLTFLAFLAIVLPLYYRSRHETQNIVLTVASYVFYGWWDVRFLLLLWLSTGVDFLVGRGLDGTTDERRRRALIMVSIAGNLTLLGFFKYFNFFADSFVKVLHALGMDADPVTLRIILPVGISFYTFQSLSYTIDVYRRRLPAAKRLRDFALYISFFPQLVAGPIERAVTLLPQVQRPRVVDTSKVLDGIWLMLIGYMKKLLIADRAAEIVAYGFSGHALPPAMSSWVYTYAFAFQIYGDFSGYSDIARGLSRLLGFELMVNFRAPYLVTNPSDFWRHWHISLSSWLRDYLYVPLGGNRLGPVKTYRNLLITMVLGGLWHGAGWAYFSWGVFHGGLLALHRALTRPLDAVSRSIGARAFWWISLIVFFHLTCIGWLIFRAGGLPRNVDQVAFIFNSLKSLFSGPLFDTAHVEETIRAVRVVGFCGAIALLMQAANEQMEDFHAWSWPRQVATCTSVLVLISLLGVFSGAEFIYFQF